MPKGTFICKFTVYFEEKYAKYGTPEHLEPACGYVYELGQVCHETHKSRDPRLFTDLLKLLELAPGTLRELLAGRGPKR
jgi:hypothetical protein